MSDLAKRRLAPSRPHVSATPSAVVRRQGMLVALVYAAINGAIVALVMPHGPATSGEALLVIAMSLGIGLCIAMLAPGWKTVAGAVAAYVAAVELGRLNAAGPTVDAIRLDNTFGILAFILGRGLHGALAFPPIITGAALMRAWVARRSGITINGKGVLLWRRLPLLLNTGLMLALVVLIAIPASTPPITGAGGAELAGSIASLETVMLGGHEQAILLRGYDQNRPVLLYLSGGPGQSSLPWPRILFEDLTRDVVLVMWDQRGAGKSYAALDPTTTLTLEQMVQDTIALTEYLCRRFDEEKIYLLGESWGTTLAVLAAQQRPDLYHALISSGQMVSQRETDRRLYTDVLELAARTGDTALAEQMQAFGAPPYADIYAYAFVMMQYENLYKPYTLPPAYVQRRAEADLGPWYVKGSEYNMIDKINVFRGFLDTAAILYPQLQGIDFRRDVPALETPLYLLDGAAELDARRDLALAWFETVDAPIKRRYTFENAAHATAFEQFEAFQQLMITTILPETYGK